MKCSYADVQMKCISIPQQGRLTLKAHDCLSVECGEDDVLTPGAPDAISLNRAKSLYGVGFTHPSLGRF